MRELTLNEIQTVNGCASTSAVVAGVLGAGAAIATVGEVALSVVAAPEVAAAGVYIWSRSCFGSWSRPLRDGRIILLISQSCEPYQS